MNGLQSALARPHNLRAYESPAPSLFRLASAYAAGISKNHPFVDGNKRTAAVVAITFLAKNGVKTAADEEELAEMFERLAAGKLNESRLADWLEKISVPARKSPKRAK